VRISELARATGVSVPTIKYYLREGLLPSGTPTASNQADYDVTHVERLRLLRTLREVGKVPVSRLRDLVAALERDGGTVHDVLATANDALSPTPPPDVDPRARALADDLVAEAGWNRVRPEAPDRDNLAAALQAVLGAVSTDAGRNVLRAYATAADRIGALDIASIAAGDRQSVLRRMVVGSAVFGEILSALRRLADEHHSALRFGDQDGERVR
jgi:DNA-binding transcriptional MerR regulator